MQKYQYFEAYCKDKTSKYTVCPLKKPKIEIFIASNSPKKFSEAESLKYDRLRTRRSVYAKYG